MFKRLAPFLVVLALLGVFSASAAAQAGWELNALTRPTYLHPGGRAAVVIRVINVGATSSEGTVTVTDTLPPGVSATKAGGAESSLIKVGPEESEPQINPPSSDEWECHGPGGGSVAGAQVVTCVNNPAIMPNLTGGGGNPTGPGTQPFSSSHADAELYIGVTAPLSEGTIAEPNRVTITGGGALSAASTRDPITVSATPAPFGLTADGWFSNANGTIDTQAGSHPYEATFVTNFNTTFTSHGISPEQGAGGEVRNVTFNLPPGFVGNPYAVPRCTLAQFSATRCPPASQVGILSAESLGEHFFSEYENSNGVEHGHDTTPVYNLSPPVGEPAELGFQFLANPTFIATHIRSGSDSGLTSQVTNVPQRNVLGSVLTLWGEPGNPSHALWHEGTNIQIPEKPFLTLPTSCEGPQELSASMTAWENPSLLARTSFPSHNANDEPAGATGCELLGFAQTLGVEPDTSNADTPGGETASIKSQQGAIEGAEGVADTDLKHVTFTLPAGVAINPGQGAGLEACQFAESGIGVEATTAEPLLGEPHCPNASKVGTDEAELPILAHPLRGNIYVLPSEPPHLLLLFTLAGEGVSAKLIGRVEMDEATGQLSAHFGEPITAQEEAEDPTLKELKGHMVLPQAPVSNFRASFGGGPQAALSGPTKCGIYTAEAEATPWASPFIASVFPAAIFKIDHGTNGAACPPTPLPYTPSLIAGSTTDQAGGYTDFSLLLQVPDDQQRTSRLQFKTPEGLLGMLSKVPLCPEAQANAGDCPEASQIGHTVVQSGPGAYPLVVPQPGQPPAPIYLTGPYEGAPFGLSVVVPVHVGPFTLKTQVIRGKIEVDPLTTQLTITTDPLPQYVAGIPTDLRTINTVIDRPGFMFNPTGCSSQSFQGTAFGNEGAQSPIGSHFQMGSCRSLLFKPNFKVFTSGKTSRASGASLGARIVYPTGDLGANQASSQSNIRLVKVELPRQLPSRLTTLQKACTAAQFNANPAGCPAASVVGHATAITPVLPVPLNGPAYFVSNGSEAFPNLIVVLQGYGVTVHLVGDTFISKAGITSSTFKQVPDVPIGSFELNLPEGKNSALAANGNLCTSKLVMPTTFIAQNGATLNLSTPISVTGCKPAIRVVRHAVKGKTATIVVSVPSAGRLVASGAGLSKVRGKASGTGTVTLKLALSNGEQAFLTRHAGRKLKTRINLSFTPTKGGRLSTSVAVLIA